jgi:low affinity Fe/Cu permease
MAEPKSARFHKPSAKREQLEQVHRRHVQRVRDVGSRKGNRNLFQRFAQTTSSAMGTPWAFCFAALAVIVWATLGPVFEFSDTWQLVINTSTTIITFLMVFLIQNTQNRDTEALRLKLDELILVTKEARNEFVQIEDLGDDELKELESSLRALADEADDA